MLSSSFVALIVIHAIYGYELNDGNYRIVQGEDAKEGEFPFMVSLRTISGEHYCGGTIITKNWVLTSGYCCFKRGRVHLTSGSIYLSHGGNTHKVSKIVTHERFTMRYLFFDVCVIRVAESFTFNEKVQPAILRKEDWQGEPDDKYGTVGWGRKQWKPSTSSDRLQKLDGLTLLSLEECEEWSTLYMYPGFICAITETEEQGVCQGDHGNPLLNNGTVVAVITHFYYPCRNLTPVITTSVPYFLDWIKERLGPEAVDLKISD